MPIPESQLQTWSHQGAVTTAKATADSVRHAIDSFRGWSSKPQYEVYLQGSYKNDTNIRGDSDVDVVVQLNSSWQSYLSKLTELERQAYRSFTSPATYDWSAFRQDILTCLRAYYGAANVAESNKCLKLKPAPGRLPADVIVCQQYRYYFRFRSSTDQEFAEGMTFYAPSDGRWVVNYPKHHYSNGVEKNSATQRWYKPVVRVVKNAREYLVDHGLLPHNAAPSYFLECLSYNVPNEAFGGGFEDSLLRYLQWLSAADITRLKRQSGQEGLVGSHPDLWPVGNAGAFIMAIITLWNDW